MHYRREIDGLRALAVLPVVLFHAGLDAFKGGFVGVDVFFVISGYLITSIITKELESDRFSLVGFYERRVRRILPALFFVMFACLPFAWWLMLPGEMKTFSQSLAAVSVYISNIFFWNSSSYFGGAADLNPMLHTWSLAVEEQYYLLFPLFFCLIWKYLIKSRTLILLSVTLISLIISEWAVSAGYYSAAFYLLPSRAWELLTGALVAIWSFSETGRRVKVPPLVSEIGGGPE